MKLSERAQSIGLGLFAIGVALLLGARSIEMGLTQDQTIGVVIWLGNYVAWGVFGIWFGLARHEWLAVRRRDRPHRDSPIGLPFTSRTTWLFFFTGLVATPIRGAAFAPPPVNWMHSLGYVIWLLCMGCFIFAALHAASQPTRHPA